MSLRSSPLSGLIEDLVEEILARVPATSLRRLRSTCKKWNTLLNDRRFTKKHFEKAENKYFNLMLCENKLSWMSINLQRLHGNTDPSAIELKSELSPNNFHNNTDGWGFNVFHCNGFLLCTNKSTIVVWNPCTGQTKWILTKSVNNIYDEYALGYVNKKLCREYKILRFLNRKTSGLEIFEFNSDSWRVSDSVNPDLELNIDGGMSVKGNTYWIASDKESVNSFLICFDFTTERFKPRVCLPFQGHFDLHAMSLYSVREERLSVLFKNNDTSKIEIWMTNDIIETNVMSWSKVLWLDFNFAHQFLSEISFCIDLENKLAVLSEYEYHGVRTDIATHFVYIIKENRCRIVNLGDEPHYLVRPHIFSYVISLVQI